CQQYYGAPYSF
nr:immunoglobulin light chain junction region [Macaca mulatta]MOX53375.1 immunoglobulin light chain junction region [Macaca mulatta]MOX56766.1 immunoglobulin light chain junction region [Macaca mulatta]MOX57089.1 immunoglobulin light chain junction region [Macaca mulatta]MOX58049.1 immunoglobulin light chain junction region [Macaca mulatta]